jgi:prepilin-type N-terminal cleavage/methylation domain-containing protein
MARFWQHYILRNIWAPIKNKKGVTLVELLVALGLSSLLVIFVFSLHLFSNKLVTEWTKKAELEDIALLSIETLKRDISKTKTLLAAEKEKIELINQNDKKITYEIRDQGLSRNGESLTKNKISVENLSFNYYHKSELSQTGYLLAKDEKELDKNMNFRLDGEELEQISGVKISLSLSGYNKKIDIESFVRLRNSISVY